MTKGSGTGQMIAALAVGSVVLLTVLLIAEIVYRWAVG